MASQLAIFLTQLTNMPWRVLTTVLCWSGLRHHGGGPGGAGPASGRLLDAGSVPAAAVGDVVSLLDCCLGGALADGCWGKSFRAKVAYEKGAMEGLAEQGVVLPLLKGGLAVPCRYYWTPNIARLT